jgi:aspartate 1-decarboxylase
VSLDAKEVENHKPTLVYLNENNDITHMRHSIPVQAA